MSYLINKVSGAVSQNLPSDSIEYQSAAALRTVAGGGTTVFEEIAEQDVNQAGLRCLVIADPGAAVGADELVTGYGEPGRPGIITAVAMFANAPGIVGAGTNTRTITVVQGSAQGGGTPARTTLATLALTAGVNAPTGVASTAFTINSAAFIAGAPLEVNSVHVGTGIADPGGLIVVTYTPV